MSFYEPLHCRLDAFTALRDELAELETTDGLVRAAVAVAMHELDPDEADPLRVMTQLDDLADQVRGRVVGNAPRALLAHAHHVLFEEARYRGNLGDYDNAGNSYLPRVLKSRLGLPIMLALVYKAVLERLGISTFGINAPGHFLAAVPAVTVGSIVSKRDDLAMIDPFCGGVLLSRDEAIHRIAQNAGSDMLLDENVDLLPVATHKQWLIRILNNLHMGFDRRGQVDDSRAMSEMIWLVEQEG
ncbi:MAG: transglutaminase-like domain-containing protein [Phycisphaeraceae bacterium]|nr:transglutaminase-like domain-containing protein [Phycisphaeraceae bacterium]